ncbi:uncharacterized protein LOC111879547 [Lactuca sativa]|uniref:uncharacterized protein LOC111879547 n=1 Tax=Lactuca sativa TaxID=4236 RepID=UPI000CD99315|nr:uncharacterized protein LOC111879547 [Lactuca sativa]
MKKKRKVDVDALDKLIYRELVEEHVEEHVEDHVEVEVKDLEEQEPVKELVHICDPRRWEKCNYDEIKRLVEKGPKRYTSIMYGLYDKFVFRKGISKGKLDSEGYADWHHVTTRVKEHEISLDHLINRNKWFDMRKISNLNETIDKLQDEQFKKERDY